MSETEAPPQDQPPPKNARKARPGNTNAVKHGVYLNSAKHEAKLTRDRFRRRGERDAREILTSAGLQKDPTARLVCRQIGRLEAMAHRLESWHRSRGYFTKDGELKGSVSKEVDVIAKLLDEARRLLEMLIERAKSQPSSGGGSRIYRVESDPSPYCVRCDAEMTESLARLAQKPSGKRSAVDKGIDQGVTAPAAGPAAQPREAVKKREPTDAERYGWRPLR